MKPQLLHCSYHKCLTTYFHRVASVVFNAVLFAGSGYRHFNSCLDAFYAGAPSLRLASVNNHVVDLDRFEDVRVSRFVRDPRDLVVSGYFYHRRGAEDWTRWVGPSNTDWTVVNGRVPNGVGPQRSYAQYLDSVSLEEGLIAEIDFRAFHFDTMRAWPTNDPRVRTYRYEDVLGREREVFADMFAFYDLPLPARVLGGLVAHRYSATSRSRRTGHIRDPRPQQWRQHFTPRVTRHFEDHHADLLEQYGYA